MAERTVLTSEQAQRFREQVLEGVSTGRLAKSFNMSFYRVATVCQELGIDPPRKRRSSGSRAGMIKDPRAKKLKPPSGADPAVVALFEAIRTSNRAWWNIEEAAGFSLRQLGYRGGGYITTVRAGLNTLGLDLAVVPLERTP